MEAQASGSSRPATDEPQRPAAYKAGNKQITVQSGNGKKAIVDVPPGQIARVTVPNPAERNKRTQIIMADLPPGEKPLSAAIARQNNPGGFASNCALTAAGCLTVASATVGRPGQVDGLQAGAGASMIAAGTLGMANSFGVDRKAVEFGKKCVGAACKGIQGMMAKKPPAAEAESPATPQGPVTRQGSFAASVEDLPVRRR